ncbi:MAG: tetratricopeptide repeat protein [Acidobacteria bacterium]|nr:tetratricopeptide repeat protein [Acidobacteriota bacterium]
MLLVFMSWTLLCPLQESSFQQSMDDLKRMVNREPESAIQLGKQLLETCKQNGDRHNQAHVEFRMASAFLRVSDFDAAMNHIQSCRSLLAEEPQVTLTIGCATLEGTIHATQHRYPQALEAYLVGIEFAKRNQLPENEADLLSNMAIVYRRMGDYAMALSTNLASLEIRETIDDPMGLANTLNNISSVYYDLGNLQEAYVYLERSLDVKRGIEDPRALSIALNNLGTVALELGQLDRARDLLTESLALKRVLGNKDATATTLNALAQVHIKLHELDRARELLDEAGVLSAELNDPSINTDRNSAESMWFRANGQMDQALSHAVAAVDLARPLGNKKRLSDTLMALSHVLSESGQHDKALEVYREAHDQYVDAFDEQTRLQTADLQSRIEANQKTRQLNELKHDHQIQELELNRKVWVRNAWITGLVSLLLFVWAIYLVRSRHNQRQVNQQLERRVAERTADLQAKTQALANMQHQLTEAAHHAGMAELAMGVLHHIGNALNQVNTSAGVLLEQLHDVRSLELLDNIAVALKENQHNLDQFLSEKPAFPSALTRMAEQLRDRNHGLVQEVVQLREGLVEVNAMVHDQEIHANVQWATETLPVSVLIHDTMNSHRHMMAAHDIDLRIQGDSEATVAIQKLRVQRALFGLLQHIVGYTGQIQGERWLQVSFRHNSDQLLIDFQHPCDQLNQDQIDQWFHQNASSDKQLGLHNCATLLVEMNGAIAASLDSGRVHYAVQVPIKVTTKEQKYV